MINSCTYRLEICIKTMSVPNFTSATIPVDKNVNINKLNFPHGCNVLGCVFSRCLKYQISKNKLVQKLLCDKVSTV